MAVTLRTIADEVGLTTMTVSYALRGSPQVSAETRTRVLAVAKRLGYRPNASARAIRSGRFDCIAVLVDPDLRGGSLSTGMLLGLQRELSQTRRHLLIDRIDDDQLDDPAYLPHILRDQRVDGLVLNYHTRRPAGLKRLLKTVAVPAVWINADVDHDAVRWDDRAAARDLTNHLLGLGHRRIAYVDFGFHYPAGAPRHYSRDHRFAGYTLAMSAAGLAPVSVFNAADGSDGGADHRVATAVLAALEQAGRLPTACVVYGTWIADVLGMVLRERFGRRTPQDVAIAGFMADASAGFPTAERSVALTGMVQSDEDLGAAAARLLLAKLAAPHKPLPSIDLPMRLSTGATATVASPRHT